jgi:biotin operon repressor
MAKKLSTKQKMLAFLQKKTGQNTFTVAQARNLFKVVNVSARISELRQDGYKIKTVEKKTKAGTTTAYQLA